MFKLFKRIMDLWCSSALILLPGFASEPSLIVFNFKFPPLVLLSTIRQQFAVPEMKIKISFTSEEANNAKILLLKLDYR